MRQLGISIYVDQSTVEENIRYIEKAYECGFRRIFTCLISAEAEGQFINDFKKVVGHARDLGYEIVADVSPDVFKALEIKWSDLSIFKSWGLTGIRLDLGFSGMEESFMSFDDADLAIELNMSNGTRYLDNILSYMPKTVNIIGCHNFYPHRYTGLSREHFLMCSKQFKDKNIRTAAFVSSSGTIGPWPVSEGLSTLEEHRELPIDVQAKDLYNTGLIDDVIIANAFASDKELESLGNLNRYMLELKVSEKAVLNDVEKAIIYTEPHFNRGDVSEYMIRSTQSRVKYKGERFELKNPKKTIEPGDVILESELYKRYAGELQIAIKEMVNSGKSSVVASVVEEEKYLLSNIKPWQKFRFVKE